MISIEFLRKAVSLEGVAKADTNQKFNRIQIGSRYLK